MPGGHARSQQANTRWVLVQRDDAMLDWINRHGVVTVDLVADRFFRHDDGTPAKWAAYKRVQKLRELGLLATTPVRLDLPHAVTVTRRGAQMGENGLEPGPKRPPDFEHAISVIRLLNELEREHPEAKLITERQWRQRLRKEIKERKRDADMGRIPDAVLEFPDGKQIAIERDRAPRRTRQYEPIVRAYFHERFYRVWWFVANQSIAQRLEEVVIGMRADDWIEVFVRALE